VATSTPRPVGPIPLPPAGDGRAADLLARAFWDDPVMVHLLPDDASRYRRLVRFYAFALADGRRRGLVHTTDGLEAVTVWHAPGERRVTPTDVARAAPMGLQAFGPRRLRPAMDAFEAIGRHHPRHHHWYLALVASDPGCRGRGAAAALLEPVLARADDEGVPAYLESSKASNVPYYERFGFEVTEELVLPGGGPPMWLMWRTPGTSTATR
jgi:GNAT superfamily N-acetyltransferase